MRLVKQNVEILDSEDYSFTGVKKMIEIAGRTCYKSENNITEDSSERFVQALTNSGHGAMLEHGTIYLKIPHNPFSNIEDFTFRYRYDPHSKVTNPYDSPVYVTTNYRVLVENGWLDDLKYLCEPTEYHERRVTVRFTVNRQVSHELVRHRVFSFAQESTRYCNYIKDKFGKQLSFIIPNWTNLKEGEYLNGDWPETHNVQEIKFVKYLFECENTYFELMQNPIDTDLEWTTQQCANILPNCLKTEVIMTGTIEQWKGFLHLRSSDYSKEGERAHPQIKEVANKLYHMLKEKSLL